MWRAVEKKKFINFILSRNFFFASLKILSLSLTYIADTTK